MICISGLYLVLTKHPHEMSVLLKVIPEKQRWLKNLIMQMYFTRVKNKNVTELTVSRVSSVSDMIRSKNDLFQVREVTENLFKNIKNFCQCDLLIYIYCESQFTVNIVPL